MLLNSLLLCNYYFVKKLRQMTDKESGTLFQKMNDLQDYLFSRCCGSGNGIMSKLDGLQNCWSSFQGKMSSLLIGDVFDTSSVEYFPGWNPIPLKVGALSTAILLIVSVIFVLSGDYINNGGDSQSSCEKKEFEEKNKIFEEYVYGRDVTNYNVGKKQFDATNSFSQALVKDTTLFGTNGFECPGGNGTKAEYTNMGLVLTNGPFFPGYCEEALELAINVSRDIACVENEKFCSEESASSMSGGAIASTSSFTATMCSMVETPVSCLPHSLDADIGLSQNYRIQQFKKSTEDLDSSEEGDLTTNSGDRSPIPNPINDLLAQANAVGDIFTIYKCISMFFPSPMKLFVTPLYVQAQSIIFGNTFLIGVFGIWSVVQYVNSIIRSPEFQQHFQNLINDPCFLDDSFVNARYDIVDNICEPLTEMENNWTNEKIRIDSILSEVVSFQDNCSCVSPYLNLAEIETLSTTPSNKQEADEIGFAQEWTFDVKRTMNGTTTSETPYTPTQNSTFVADTQICYDSVHALKYILSSSSNEDDEQEEEEEEEKPGFWQIWVTSGLLATFLMKISITNYTMALYNYADPFASCNGSYEGPPDSFAEFIDIGEEVTEQKKKELQFSSLRSLILWCILTNFCMLSLFLSTKFGDFSALEYSLFGVFLGLAVFVPIPCYLLMRNGPTEEGSDVDESPDDWDDDSGNKKSESESADA